MPSGWWFNQRLNRIGAIISSCHSFVKIFVDPRSKPRKILRSGMMTAVDHRALAVVDNPIKIFYTSHRYL
jgi:hypothetical protein